MSDTWIEQTSAFDRVKSVALTLSEPQSAAWIAEEAAVAENTARNHLSRLVDLGVLRRTTGDEGAAYAPDPIYTRSQDIRELVSDASTDQLASEAVELQTEVQQYRDTYGVETPAELRASLASTDCDPETARERLEAASDWEHARYRLSLLRDALEHFDTYTSPGSAPA